MTLIDYVIVGIIGVSAFIGLLRGIIREMISLLVWLSALWIAWRYFRNVAEYLPYWIESPSIRYGLAAIALFLVVIIFGGMFGMMLGVLMDKSGLSSMDQLFGMIFGMLRGVVLIMILVLIGGLTSFPKDLWWQNSRLLVPMQRTALWLLELLPYDIARFFRF